MICLNPALGPYLHYAMMSGARAVTLLNTCALKEMDEVKLYTISCLDLFVYNLKTANR